MKKIVVMVLKVFGAVILILMISLFFFLITSPFVNDHVARKTLEQLTELPLPSGTEYVESLCKASKLVGCGNGMQYFGAILIKSELSYEELRDYYSNFAEYEWECVVENQVGTKIKAVDDPWLSFKTEGDNYYIVYSWGSNHTIFDEFDIRGY